MKMLIVVSLLSLSSIAFSQTPTATSANFDQMKQMRLQHIDQRISREQNHRACVASAADHVTMKACKDAAKAAAQQAKAAWQAEKGSFKAQRQANKKK
jgi:hypothetical protein